MKSKFRYRLVAVGLVVAVLGPWTQSAGAEEVRLVGDELRQLYVDKCVTGLTKRQTEFTVCARADGKAVLKWDTSGRTGNDKGKWRIKDDMMCTKWKNVRNRTEQCSVVKRSSEGKLKSYNPDGSFRTYYTRITDYK